MIGDEDSQLEARYGEMTDSQLLDLARDYEELRASAQTLLRAEFKHRSLVLPNVTPGPADTEQQRLEKLYRAMSELQLMRVAQTYDTLSTLAQDCLRHEFNLRSLEPPIIPDDAAGSAVPLADPVVIRSFRDLSEAIVARAYLQSEGIACSLRDENTVRQDWLYSNFIGGMRLQVSAADADRALALLDHPQPESMPLDDGTIYRQPICPRCASTDIALYDGMLKPAAATLLLVGLPLPRFAGRDAAEVWRCAKCGCIWINDSQPEPS